MGAWGAGIFADDDAADVRDEFRTLLGQGLSTEEATQRLVDEWSEVIAGGLGTSFWLALAKTQSDFGRLQENVKERALEIIESGTDLERYTEDRTLLARRREVLQKLRSQLQSPQKPPTRVRKRFIEDINVKAGDVISYTLPSGKVTLMRVLGKYTDKGGSYPIVELCDWIGNSVPSLSDMQRLTHRRFVNPQDGTTLSQFILVRTRKSELPEDRVAIVGRGIGSNQRAFSTVGFSNLIHWKNLDSLFGNIFKES